MLGERTTRTPLQKREYYMRDRPKKSQNPQEETGQGFTDWTDDESPSQESMDSDSMTESFCSNYSDALRETLSIPEPTVVFTVSTLLQAILAIRADGEEKMALRF
jgi:hypothetical protein